MLWPPPKERTPERIDVWSDILVTKKKKKSTPWKSSFATNITYIFFCFLKPLLGREMDMIVWFRDRVVLNDDWEIGLLKWIYVTKMKLI